MTCASCHRSCIVTLVITGRGGVSYICPVCYFPPRDVAMPTRSKKR